MDKQELNKKLAEWRGLKDFQIFADHAGRYYKMQFIDPEHSQLYIVCDAFYLSLDACFQWLVPQLAGWEVAYKYYLTGKIYHAKVWAKDGIRREGWDKTNPALALCLAIEKLIDSETPK